MIVPLSEAQFRARIDAILAGYQSGGTRSSVIAPGAKQGKLYELWVAAEVLRRLAIHEGYTATLRGGTSLVLRSQGGPISLAYAHFELAHPRRPPLAMWTDIEFVGMSYGLTGPTSRLAGAFYHELDLVVVDAGVTGRPRHDQIVIGVECKNTNTYEKRMAREAFGVRRELSLLQPGRTRFRSWPIADVPAVPPSCLMVYASDGRVSRYVDPGVAYGVQFEHLSAP
ncbi:hypothetical protein GCM10009867_22470 [Pedococcus aerophilus]|uniref:Uncharacterized protein n=1 Tax=Pedococcus aerophilus TaxID=436356 RepID=A0ABN3UTQ0_9MICO